MPFVTTDEFNPDFREGALGAKDAADWIETVKDLHRRIEEFELKRKVEQQQSPEHA